MARITAFAVCATLVCAVSAGALAADPNYYSKFNVLTGASQVAGSANYGQGVTFGDLDTGIVPWVGFSSAYNGQGVDNIDTVNSGVCLGGSCTSGQFVTDGHGHGTFTASQIVGAVTHFDANGNGYSGVAAGGKMVAVQVLNANGSGTTNDVANGIRYAVDHGAQVLNLSLGPGGSSAQQEAFYESLAGAVNYAASKNAYVVFAGGNSKQNLAGGRTLNGFTDAAIARLLFVGATKANKQISSYSNKPGSAGFVSTTNKSTKYQNMWVMAPGGDVNWFGQLTDPINGASNSNSGGCAGYICLTSSAGTSMAAPQATGAIGLLLARWPVLIANGNAAKILAQSAADLGQKGADATYGMGFLNLVKAFQPSGSLLASTSSGGSVIVAGDGAGQGGTAALARGALGSMPGVARGLSNYTVFDGFGRDFNMNLSGLVAAKPSQSGVVQSIGAPAVTGKTVRFTDGSRMSFNNMKNLDLAPDITRPQGREEAKHWSMSFTDATGATMAAGSGFPAAASFAGALWGTDSPAAQISYGLGVSDALTGLAQGGHFTAYGAPVGHNARIAFSWSQTQARDALDASDWTRADASAFQSGLIGKIASGWKAGMTIGVLKERAGLLGTTYDPNGALSLGDDRSSVSFGLSSVFALAEKTDFLVEGAVARADASGYAGSILSDMSPLYARSLGASLARRDAFKDGDRLSLSVRAPLRVMAGSASLATTSVNDLGMATTASQRVSLRPDGSQLDFSLGYEALVSKNVSWNASLQHRRDADNIRGANDSAFLLGTKIRF